MKKIKKNDINLKDTITCGQIFRYEILDNSYIIILEDRVVELSEDDTYIYINSSNEVDIEKIITDFLDLNRDYNEILSYLIKNDNNLIDIIKSVYDRDIIITNLDKIVLTTKDYKDYINLELSPYLANIVDNRKDISELIPVNLSLNSNMSDIKVSYSIKSIIVNGDMIGLLILNQLV